MPRQQRTAPSTRPPMPNGSAMKPLRAAARRRMVACTSTPAICKRDRGGEVVRLLVDGRGLRATRPTSTCLPVKMPGGSERSRRRAPGSTTPLTTPRRGAPLKRNRCGAEGRGRRCLKPGSATRPPAPATGGPSIVSARAAEHTIRIVRESGSTPTARRGRCERRDRLGPLRHRVAAILDDRLIGAPG